MPFEQDQSAKGVAFEEGSSRKHHAQLRAGPAGVRLVADDGSSGDGWWEHGEILAHGTPLVRERIGRDIVLIFEGGTRFETRDVEMVQALLGPHASDLLSESEGWHPRLIGFVAMSFAGVAAIWFWGLPLLIAVAIWLTPPNFVAAVDRANMQAIDVAIAEPSRLDDATRAQALAIFERVKSHAPPAPFGDYTLEFRALDGMGPNAFALPGGTMVLTDTLVEDFADPNVIASIIGHEMAHVSEKHSLKQLYRSLSVYLLVALIIGDAGPILDDLLLEGGVLLSLSYSRQHEYEADEIGVRTALDAGYDPRGMIAFFEALEHEYGDVGPEYLSTHPAHGHRVEEIERIIDEAK